MKQTIILSFFLVPIFLIASGDAESTRYFAQTGRETDFFPRVVNFTIFAAILYYLVANPIKNFFKERKEAIAKQLKEIEERLQAAKNEKKEAQLQLEEAEKRAEQIISDAEKEAKLLADKILQSTEVELENLSKQFEEKTSLEERKAAREAIDEVLGENINNEDISLDEKKVVDIISTNVNKKVA